MQDLFSHEAQNSNRDRTVIEALTDAALAKGFSIRIEDAHGDNQTRETRDRKTILAAAGQSRETKFHIIDLRGPMPRNQGNVTVYHGEDVDRITTWTSQPPFCDVLDEIVNAVPLPAHYGEEVHVQRTPKEVQEAQTQIEIVPTSALKEGDLLRCNGCTMQLGPINESKAHKPDQHGAVYWSRATVLDEVGSHIPKAWLDVDAEGNRTWLVQGNDLAKWRRLT